jgi:DNA helicase-2/ATP-dependent DNA helicase PcrA
VPDGVFDEGEEYSDDDSTNTDHLSPRGRGRAAGAGEGGGDNFSPSPSPGSPRLGRGSPPSPTRGEGKRRRSAAPLTIEGELIAKSTGAVSAFDVGARVFHQKFGNGNVVAVDGNKLTIKFDKAGEKRVVDSFVKRV